MAAPSPRPIRVLLIEDEEAHYQVTRALLQGAERADFELGWVKTFDDAREAIALGEHDVYLVDYFLEDRTGLDLIREVARSGARRPVIMLTGKGDRSVDLQAMKAGASDYLVKGSFDPPTLERSILYALEAHRATEALLAAEARSRRTFDHLPIGLFRMSPAGELLEANPALHELLGYPDEALLRSGFARDWFVSSEDAPGFRATLEASGRVRGFESELRRVNGSTVGVRVSAWCYGEDGRVEYVEGSVEAVADRPHPMTVPACEPSMRRLP